VKIIPNPASQRTFGENISIHLNKQINGIQKIVYSNDTSVFLGTMNPDGTEWTTKKIIDTMYSVQLADIYNDKIYIYIGNLYIFDSEGNTLSVAEMAMGVGSGEYFDFNNSKIYGWTRDKYYYVSINSINFDGTGYETHKITTRTFTTYFYFQRLGNKLVYFYVVSGIRLYTATSDLDCSNFIGVDTTLRPTGYGRSINNGTIAYLDFYFYDDEEGFGGFQLGMLDSAGNFSYIQEEVSGWTHYGTFIKNSYLYYVTVGGDLTDSDIYVAKADLSGNVLFEDEYIIPEGVYNDLFVDPYDNGNIYAWQQYDVVTELANLWTYPGDYIEPIEPVLPLPSPHPWPMIGQNYSNTYASPYQFSNKLSEKWRTQLDDYILSLLISEDNTMYACLYNGKVVSLTSEGNINWTYETNDPTLRIPIRASIIGANNNIYVSSDDGNIIALNTSGDLIWKVLLENVTNGFIGGFTNNNGTLYFVESNKLHSLDYDGNVKWTFNAYTDSLSILDDNGTIYINDYVYNTLYALNYDGSVKWQKVGLGQTYSLSVAPNGNIYFMQYNYNSGNSLIVLNPTDGNEIWRYALNNNGISYSTAIDYNNYYYFTYNDSLGTGFIIIDSNGIELFNSIPLNNLINYSYISKISLDNNGTIYINGNNSTKAVIITYNLYTNVYEINIINDYFDANGFSMNNGNYLYAYCSGGEIVAFEKIIVLPQVQCRATQIIASANTGKIILAVPIL